MTAQGMSVGDLMPAVNFPYALKSLLLRSEIEISSFLDCWELGGIFLVL